MKTVWIFQTGEPLHCDKDPRPMRAMNLSNQLIKNGFNVVIWTSNFFHQEKRHRFKNPTNLRINKNLTINFIHSMGYQGNISIMRFLDHYQLAYNLKKSLSLSTDLPDIAFVGFPPIEFSYTAIKFFKNRNIPTILDIKDQWPEMFLDPIPTLLRPFATLILLPLFKMSKKAIRLADAVTTISNSYLNWALSFSGRSIQNFDNVIPLAPMNVTKDHFDPIDLDTDKKKVYENLVIKNSMKIIFIGNFMQTAFNFEPLISAATYFSGLGNLKVDFIICGDGQTYDDFVKRTSSLSSVHRLGRVNRREFEIFSKISSIGIAPVRNIPNFSLSIPNKVIDYLSVGLPLITSLGGEVQKLIKESQIGIVYDENNHHSLINAINSYLDNMELIKIHSQNAKLLFNTRFDGQAVYSKAVKIIEEMI